MRGGIGRFFVFGGLISCFIMSLVCLQCRFVYILSHTLTDRCVDSGIIDGMGGWKKDRVRSGKLNLHILFKLIILYSLTASRAHSMSSQLVHHTGRDKIFHQDDCPPVRTNAAQSSGAQS